MSTYDSTIRRIITSRLSPEQAAVFQDDLPLVDGGLELDSIELAEILDDCETETGIEVTTDFFSGGTLTLRRLVGFFDAAAGR